ncbi:MAG TPA: SDR family NAD(P)-dependent oxidoreductase [Pseudonocardiaceae bacterium]|jgi:NAD(P)-dependent dehydrogenase (short-subunit alcohol dehydrogenase family)|nr:SDR family NAD(P)-dependent oxidoreductase [Pseudonocardiaceae bacterium]
MSTLRRTALVLGATGELGGDIARRMVGLSSTLIVHGHDEGALAVLCAELAGSDERCRVVAVPADFASLSATRELVRRCSRASGEMDFVVNSVDLLPPRTRSITEDGNELTWQVNYLGPAMVALGLLPLLRNSMAGRIVHVVRDQQRIGVPKATELGGGRRYYPAWSYTEAKLALMMLSQTMAAKLRGTGCRSLAIQPAGAEVGAAPAPLSRGLMVDAVLYACTSPTVPNGAYLRGRRVHPLPRAAAGAAAQQRMWRATCRTLGLDVRTGWPMRPPDLADQPLVTREV